MTDVNLENSIFTINGAGHGHALVEAIEAEPGSDLTIEGAGDLGQCLNNPKLYRADPIEISPEGIVVGDQPLVGSPANQVARVLGRRSGSALIEECGEGFTGTWIRFESEPVQDSAGTKKPGTKKQEAKSGKAAKGN